MPQLARPVKIGIIGYGPACNMGSLHAGLIRSVEGLEVAAVCDLNEERLKIAREELGDIKTYNDVSQLAADEEIKLVIVIVPHNVHAQCALPCLEAGKHVVVEKPMAVTIDQCTTMIETARKNGVVLTVFHNRRFDGDFLAIRDTIEAGYIGEVFHLEAHSGGYARPGTTWRSDKAVSGGQFYDWGAHFVDWVLHLIPAKMKTVTGQFQKRVWHHVTNEDHVEAYIRFANDAVAHLQLSTIAAQPKPRWYILGTKGAIVDSGGGRFKVFTRVKDHTASFDLDYYKTPGESPWRQYYQSLADHLLEDKPLFVTPESARRVIAVMELAERSSQTGEAQPVPYED